MISSLLRTIFTVLLSCLFVIQLLVNSAIAQPAPPAIEDPGSFPIQLTHLEPETQQPKEQPKTEQAQRDNTSESDIDRSKIKDLPFDPYRDYYDSYEKYELEVYGPRG